VQRYTTLSPADVKKAGLDCTVDADEFYLGFSAVASADARKEIEKHPGWDILDKRGPRSTTSRPASASSRPASASSLGDLVTTDTFLSSLCMHVQVKPGR
jgi:hypothetical protein